MFFDDHHSIELEIHHLYHMPTTPIKAIAFDAFGTLVQISTQRRAPYRSLMRWALAQGRKPQPDDAKRLMSQPLDLRGAAELFAKTPPAELLAQWEEDLAAELASIELFPDSLDTVAQLQGAGYRVGLCSNLALPYGKPVCELLPTLDVYAMSYDVGVTKPNPRIYQYLIDQLSCAPDEVLFIGDTPAADVDGPRTFGMQASLLDRKAGQSLADVIRLF
nr:HAD-IA family hydrolase [Bordetella sp. 15P40C-2]